VCIQLNIIGSTEGGIVWGSVLAMVLLILEVLAILFFGLVMYKTYQGVTPVERMDKLKSKVG
jgi:hypothetical protein